MSAVATRSEVSDAPSEEEPEGGVGLGTDEAVPQDFVTVLTSKGPILTKTWKADGTILAYDKAKHFSVEEREFTGIEGLAALVQDIATDPRKAVIRGTPKPAPT